jgi:non-ribosomal peptide synthetase component E (peptide arylation enzyme)
MEWTLAASPKSRREAHYGNRVVSCFADRPATVSDMFGATTAAKPDGEALVCGEQRWSWRKVESEVAVCAAALAERGIAAGDRVALLVGNRTEFVVALFAVLRLGAIAVPLTPATRTRRSRSPSTTAAPRCLSTKPTSRRGFRRRIRSRASAGAWSSGMTHLRNSIKPNRGEP